MARRPSLSDTALPAPTPPAPAEVPPPAPTPVTTPRSLSRAGKTGVSFWVDPDAHRQLRLLSVTEGKPIQGLMEEALDLLFRTYGKHRLAGGGRGEAS